MHRAHSEHAVHRVENMLSYLDAARPLLDRLRELGYDVLDIGELSQKKKGYGSAIPILLEFLPKITDIRVKEDIVRALSTKQARPLAAPALIQEFISEVNHENYKWSVANALTFVADDSVYNDLVRIVQDTSHGRSREMLALALVNMRNADATNVLINLLRDDDVAGHALIALRKRNAVSARPFIERFVTHPKTWWRNEAKKALAKFNRLHDRRES